MNYDDYGFPIFDDEYEDNSVVKIDVNVIKECSVEKVDLKINLESEENKSENALW